jgi:type III secretory pathway component EscR
MYSLLRNERLRKQVAADARTILTTQALTLLPALLITQLYYHWKSFLLEFGGFLITWFVIDLVVTTVRDLWRRRGSEPADPVA